MPITLFFQIREFGSRHSESFYNKMGSLSHSIIDGIRGAPKFKGKLKSQALHCHMLPALVDSK